VAACMKEREAVCVGKRPLRPGKIIALLYLQVYLGIYTYVYIYMYIYVYIYVCVYIYILTNQI
jgi:hypothetical protein